MNEIFDLFIDLGASDEQADFPIVYASAREEICGYEPDAMEKGLKPLFETVVSHVPAPSGDADKPFRMLVSNIDYDEYVGRIAVGKIDRGSLASGQTVTVCHADGSTRNAKCGKIYMYDGLKRIEAMQAGVGDVILISGLGDIGIGETLCDTACLEPLPVISVDEPTISMNFLVNNSPFAGQEGEFVTSRHLRDRLFRELDTNVSLRVEETDSADSFKVSGRGELHLSILIETMRRQGYEFQVSRPQVILKKKDDKLFEPVELLYIDLPEDYAGTVIEKLGKRHAEMLNMQPGDSGYTRLEFKIPSRGLIGYRNEFLSDTRGNGVMNTIFDGYTPYCGEIESRTRGSMIAWETGESVAYGLYNAQERGRLFIGAGVKVYEGMIVGENAKNEDITVNVCKKKHVTNMRASGSDEALRLTPPEVMSLEQCLEFISDDELVEITPKSIRLRKKLLTKMERDKQANRNKNK